MSPFPCCLVQQNKYLTFSIQNADSITLPSTALPVFRSLKQAIEFRDEVVHPTDTSTYVWTVSLCNKTKEASFQTRVRNKTNLFEYNYHRKVNPANFYFDDNQFINQLMFHKIGCLIVDSYRFNRVSNLLTVDGLLWLPFPYYGEEDDSADYISFH